MRLFIPEEDMIGQHFNPPHPVRLLQAAIDPQSRMEHSLHAPATPRQNIPPQSILIFVHDPFVYHFIDSVVQLLTWLALLFLRSYFVLS